MPLATLANTAVALSPETLSHRLLTSCVLLPMRATSMSRSFGRVQSTSWPIFVGRPSPIYHAAPA